MKIFVTDHRFRTLSASFYRIKCVFMYLDC
ncbi:unnamed protein product [Larinioides sclopetarius]|uniref:Uncharacterized protein n=1 Tax=Larinioides sclopetarius TaxID=280406 RepID=A0AAV2BCS9_9ARAC